MRINKIGPMFISLHLWDLRFLVLALHGAWRFGFVRLPAKPHVWRLHVGPLEIEHSNFRAPAHARWKQ